MSGVMTDQSQTQFEEFYKKELDKLGDKKPVGMFGHWAFHTLKRKEFKKLLEQQGIEIHK